MALVQQNALVDFLKEVPFFSEVGKTSLLRLCKNSHQEHFGKNGRIIEKGDVGDSMYVILQGSVKVHDKDHIFGTLSQGECFGEYALIDQKPRSVSVSAEEETTLLKIEASHFSDLIHSDAGFVNGVLSVLIKRHRELDIIQENLAASKREVELANSKMQGLIDGAMDAIIMFDSNFRIVLVNDSAKTLLQNKEVIQRNLLFFLDDESANFLESLVKDYQKGTSGGMNTYLPKIIKVIGSEEKGTLNEGTISSYGSDLETFYTLILRNIDDRLRNESQISSLKQQTAYLQEELKELNNDHGIIAEHKSMKKVLNLIAQVSHTDATVLIHGETGTGKELVARAIHTASNRADGPWIRVNCGAIPANLIESELFGHEKGAFTGAMASRKGRFAMADKGTIFLDEIGELPLDLQPKLLRVIQEGEFDPLGSSVTQKVDVRIIAASHRDLLQFSKDGKFREDLYYRLNVFPIEVPALRNRGNDVCLIAQSMIQHFSKKLNRKIDHMTKEQMEQLLAHDWPGNVRELQNLVERAIIVSKSGKLDWSNIISNTNPKAGILDEVESEHIYSSNEWSEMEKQNILRALRKTNWKISGEKGAAALLGLPPTTLTSKIKALGIERPV